MIKLKEIKSKSEDSGSKARQYLDGLLKVPFNVYKKEPIMYLMDEIKQNFLMVVNNIPVSVPLKEKYTSIEIKKYIVSIKQKITEDLRENNCQNIKNDLTNCDKNELINNIVKINAYIDANKLELSKVKYTSNKSKESLKNNICAFVDSCLSACLINDKFYVELLNSNIIKKIIHIEELFQKINGYISNVKHTLNSSVHGHEKAKKQIERIIGQWINGQQDGYCFGFEGPPGLGKTTLAKYGLSNCLKDDDGNNRPFAMIQMGGDSNGSTLHGHNYTYVGSTWGGIVQILMDKKCMNPIIYHRLPIERKAEA